MLKFDCKKSQKMFKKIIFFLLKWQNSERNLVKLPGTTAAENFVMIAKLLMPTIKNLKTYRIHLRDQTHKSMDRGNEVWFLKDQLSNSNPHQLNMHIDLTPKK
jgi:hypothetical protein